jgi:hypothetical protein
MTYKRMDQCIIYCNPSSSAALQNTSILFLESMVFIKENPQSHAHHPHLTEKNSWKGVVTDLIRARQTQPSQSLT